jgi:hypothetical protein
VFHVQKNTGAHLIACAAVGAYAALAGATSSRNDRFSASLDRRSEVPAPKGVSVRASKFTATLSGSKLSWKLTFKNLTGKATAAHIHMAKRGKAGPVVVPLCGPCKSGATGKAVISTAVVNAMKKGDAYVNVHTPSRTRQERSAAKSTAKSRIGSGRLRQRPDPTTWHSLWLAAFSEQRMRLSGVRMTLVSRTSLCSATTRQDRRRR